MYEIEIDQHKNRLYLKLMEMETSEAEGFLSEIETALGQLEAPFSVISDIREFSVLDPGSDSNLWAEKIIQYLHDSGMKRSVRVTGRRSKGESLDAKGYLVSMAESIEDADRFLDGVE